MKVIIAGSRTINDFTPVCDAIGESGFDITEVVSGTQDGVDKLGEVYAYLHDIPVKPFEPDWKKHGKAAGPKRNRQMAAYGDALIAIWDTKSPGTRDMIGCMTALKKPVYVKNYTFRHPPRDKKPEIKRPEQERQTEML